MHIPADNQTSAELVDFNQIPAQDFCDRRQQLILAFQQVRSRSTELASHLNPEDQNLQSMPDASPCKWHLAHTTWFFETFILADYLPDFEWYNSTFCYLFNSYYNGIGKQYPRAQRGLISRPDVDEVLDYRQHVNQHLETLLKGLDEHTFAKVAELLVLGLNHEQQHQELLLTDVKHGLSFNPAFPAYQQQALIPSEAIEQQWLDVEGGLINLGHQDTGFCFDNEQPQHQTYLHDYRISKRPVTNGEWLEFIEDGGYQQAHIWLSDGWAWRNQENISTPLYWAQKDNQWLHYTLHGLLPLDPNAPVTHISGYEAAAYANWANARLPTEAEWEHAVNTFGCSGYRALQQQQFHPTCYQTNTPFAGLGACWEWTSTAYSSYPGYQPASGAIGEYNGKFMANQMVLRGTSCATAPRHGRTSYRNFFYLPDRWQFTGLRLAMDS